MTPPLEARIFEGMEKALATWQRKGFMPRSAAALAAIFIFPGIVLSQETPEESSEQADSLHTVERGESLWFLARQYYDEPFDWRRIFEANQDAIEDPHWIYPGQHFRIPGYTSRVTGVDVSGADPGAAGAGEAATDVRGVYPGLGDRTVFSRPPRDDTPTPDERTAFYPEPAVERERGGVLGADGVEYLAVSPDVFYAASWLVPGDAAEFTGAIAGWADDDAAVERRETSFPFDRMRIEWGGGELPTQGDLLQAVRIQRSESDLGQVIRPTGILRVVQRVDGGVIAVTMNDYHQMKVGDHVTRAPTFPLEPGQYAESTEDGTEARITGFAQPRTIQQEGDVAFLDVGAADGVAVGDEFELRVSSGGGWSGQVAGKLQVIRVFEDRSSARIRQLVTPVFRPGLRVRMAGKMP